MSATYEPTFSVTFRECGDRNETTKAIRVTASEAIRVARRWAGKGAVYIMRWAWVEETDAAVFGDTFLVWTNTQGFIRAKDLTPAILWQAKAG